MSPATLAALLMLASGSVHAVVNAIVKGGRDKMAARLLTDGSSAAIMLPFTVFVPLPAGAWGAIVASAAIHLVYLYALVRTLQASDLSAAYPVFRGTAPLVTAVVAIGLLGEPASAREIAGIALIGGSTILLVLGRHLDRPGLRWALLVGVSIAGYTVVDAHGVRAAPTPASYIVWTFVVMGAAITAMFAVLSRGAVFAAARAQWRPGVVAGALSILTYGMALTAFALGPTARLAALRETGMVTALVIAILFLGERTTPGRIAGVVGILAGAGLLLVG